MNFPLLDFHNSNFVQGPEVPPIEDCENGNYTCGTELNNIVDVYYFDNQDTFSCKSQVNTIAHFLCIRLYFLKCIKIKVPLEKNVLYLASKLYFCFILANISGAINATGM